MKAFWGAIILRVVLLAYLSLVIYQVVQISPVGLTSLLVFFGGLFFAAVVLLQTIAALAGYASIRSRVKESVRRARADHHSK